MKKIEYLELANTSYWQNYQDLQLTQNQQYWLIGNESLTKQLTHFSEDTFELNVLTEEWLIPFQHEKEFLGLGEKELCLVREVELLCKGKITVYARSILTPQAIEASKDELKKLGSMPLGHLLFKEGKVDLLSREIAKITVEEKASFARRTCYTLYGENILVSEYFISPPWK